MRFFTFEEKIKYNIIKEGNVSIELKNNDFVIKKEVPPEGYRELSVKYDLVTLVYSEILKEGKVYLSFSERGYKLWKFPKITIIFEEIEYLGLNQNKAPELKITGKKYSGYSSISKRLFGYYRKDIALLIKPYIELREFHISDLLFVEWRTIRRTTYPVFRYGDSKKLIKGIKNLRLEFPKLSEEEIEMILETLNKPKKSLTRYEELLDKYDIYRTSIGKYTVFERSDKMREKYFEGLSFSGLINILKTTFGEKLSKETATNLRDNILSEEERLERLPAAIARKNRENIPLDEPIK